MVLREKVALVLITVVFFKTICLCTPLTINDNPFEKYLNKLKNGKCVLSSKYEIGSGQKENLITAPDSFCHHQPSFHLNEIEFPEVQYPLTADETLTPKYLNPLPTKTEYSDFNSDLTDNFINQSKKQKNMGLETILQLPAKGSKGITEAKDETHINNSVKDVSNAKNNKGLKNTTLREKLAPTALKAIVNNNQTLNQPQQSGKSKRESKKLTQSATKKMKLNSLKKIISKARLKSSQNRNSTKKVIAESLTPRFRSTQLSKVAHSNDKTNYIMCESDNLTTPCTNASNLNDIDLVPRTQNIELINDVELFSALESNLTDMITKEEYIVNNPDISLPPLTDIISDSARNDTFNNDSSKVTPGSSVINLADYKLLSKDESINETPEFLLLNNLIIDEVVNDSSSQITLGYDSTNSKYLVSDTNTGQPMPTYPRNLTDGLDYLERSEVLDHRGSFADESVRNRILEVLATEKLSISSLKESILKILLSEKQLPNEFITELPMTFNPKNDIHILKYPLSDNIKSFDSLINDENNKSQSNVTVPSDAIFEILTTPINIHEHPDTRITTNAIKTIIPETPSNTQTYDSTGTISEAVGDDSSSEKPFQTSANDSIRIKNLVPKKTEVISKVSLDVIPVPIVTEALADNLREIISNPSNSRALVDDLRQIIRLLMLWNSNINELDKKSNINEQKTDHWSQSIRDPTQKIISTAVVDDTNNMKLTFEPTIADVSDEALIEFIPDSKSLIEKPMSDSIEFITDDIAKCYEKSMTLNSKTILDSTINNNTILKDQCYIFEEPHDLNSTSNLTDINTGKLQLANVLIEPIDSKLLNITEISFKDLIMGYISNDTLDKIDASLFDDEILDFSDYEYLSTLLLSPEHDDNIDFVDNYFFNNTNPTDN